MGNNDESTACATQPAYDPKTGVAYFIENASGNGTLASIDTTTGASTQIAPLVSTTHPFISPRSIAIDAAGHAYVMAYDNESGDIEIFAVNLLTGALSAEVVAGSGNADIYAFAFDPANGLFYVVQSGGAIFTVNPTTGADSSIALFSSGLDVNSPEVWSAQIDSNGIMWVQGLDQNDNSSYLATADLNTEPMTTDLVGSIVYHDDASYNVSTDAILITPTPVAPVITTSPALASAVAGSAFTATIAATGSQLITYALTGALPAGLVLDPASGVISGTPTTPGAFSFAVTATNAAGSSAAVVFTQTITAALPVVSG